MISQDDIDAFVDDQENIPPLLRETRPSKPTTVGLIPIGGSRIGYVAEWSMALSWKGSEGESLP